MQCTAKEIISKKIFIRDINEVTFLALHNIEHKPVKQGTRVSWEVTASDEVYRLLRLYSNNPPVPILDYITVLRRLRSEMYGLRESRTLNERG